MAKEENQEAGLDSKVPVQKAQFLPSPGSRPVIPDRPDSKRKPKTKKTDSSVDNTPFIGQTIHGVVEGSFDAGYLLTVRVGDTDTLLQGVVFEPGLSVPISEVNDIAPNIRLTKRDENVLFPEAPHTSMPYGQHSNIKMLPAPAPNDAAASSFLTPDKTGSDRTDTVNRQPHATPSKSTFISEAISTSRVPSSVQVPNPLPTPPLHVQNHMEPTASNGSDETYVVARQPNVGPSTATFNSQTSSRLLFPVSSAIKEPKSVNLQNQLELPAMIGSGQSNTVHPSTSSSQPIPMTMPILNALTTSTTLAHTETRLPAINRFGQTDMLAPSDTTSSKSTSVSEAASECLSSLLKMDSPATSSFHIRNQMTPPFSVASCQTDMMTPQPDAIPPKYASVSKAASGFPLIMLKMDAPTASSIHVQSLMGSPVSIGSCQTDMVTPQQDAIPPKSTMAVAIPSLKPDANAQPTSAAHIEKKMEPPTMTGSSLMDTMVRLQNAIPVKSSFGSQGDSSLSSPMLALDTLSKSSDNAQKQVEPPILISSGQTDASCSQPDMIPSKSTSISQDIPALLFPVLVQHNQATSAVHVQDQMEWSLTIGSGHAGKVPPQSDTIPPQSTSISQTLTTMSAPLSLPNAPLPSSLVVQNKVGSLMVIGSGQTYLAACQPHTNPTISASISQALPMLAAAVPNQYSQGPSYILVQNQRGPFVRTGSSQEDIAVSQSDSTSPKTISITKDSANSEQGCHPGPSDQVCASTNANETQMDVDEEA